MSAPVASRVVPCPSCSQPVAIPPHLEGAVIACGACRKPFQPPPIQAIPVPRPLTVLPAGRADKNRAILRGRRALVAAGALACGALLSCVVLLALRYGGIRGRGVWTEAELGRELYGLTPRQVVRHIGPPDEMGGGGGNGVWIYHGMIRHDPEGKKRSDALVWIDGGRVTSVLARLERMPDLRPRPVLKHFK